MSYTKGKNTKLTLYPADGPPIEVPATAVYLTDTGRRVAFVEYVHEAELVGRLRLGQLARLVIDEGPGGEYSHIERGTLALTSRHCQVCGAIRGILVVAELPPPVPVRLRRLLRRGLDALVALLEALRR